MNGVRWMIVVRLPWLPPGHVRWRAGMTTFRHLIPHSSVQMSFTYKQTHKPEKQRPPVNKLFQESLEERDEMILFFVPHGNVK